MIISPNHKYHQNRCNRKNKTSISYISRIYTSLIKNILQFSLLKTKSFVTFSDDGNDDNVDGWDIVDLFKVIQENV